MIMAVMGIYGQFYGAIFCHLAFFMIFHIYLFSRYNLCILVIFGGISAIFSTSPNIFQIEQYLFLCNYYYY